MADINGEITDSRWEFEDGTTLTNRLFAARLWTNPGNYPIILRAFNADHPNGIAATSIVQVVNPPLHFVNIASSSPIAPYASWATAARSIQDAINAATVPGANILVSNGVYASSGALVEGTLSNRVAVTKPLHVSSVNGPTATVIQGFQDPQTTNGNGAMRCVYLFAGASLSGFTVTSGATRLYAGANFPLDYSGGGILCYGDTPLISNCVITANSAQTYGGGSYSGTYANCAFVNNTAGAGGGAYGGTLKSCRIQNNYAAGGGGAYQCWLEGCLLLTNSARSGGGAFQGFLTNCTVAGNEASDSGGGYYGDLLINAAANSVFIGNQASNYGGAIYYGRFLNCSLSGNRGGQGGGGAYSATLNNCTITANSAVDGGGTYLCHITNSVDYYNEAVTNPNDSYSTFGHCCTYPLPEDGWGNFTNPPLFLDALHGNLRLQANSPCINSGKSTCDEASTDLDGNPRIAGGTVDIGAYEFQTPGSVISYAWLQQYGFTTDGSADYVDIDSDGMNNWQEWIAGTVPTDAASVLKIVSVVSSGTTFEVGWTSVTNRSYALERAFYLGTTTGFATVQSNLLGMTFTTTCRDTNAAGDGSFFYRVRVED